MKEESILKPLSLQRSQQGADRTVTSVAAHLFSSLCSEPLGSPRFSVLSPVAFCAMLRQMVLTEEGDTVYLGHVFS